MEPNHTKLTLEQVRYIQQEGKKRRRQRRSQREIAEEFGISHQQVSKIMRGLQWA